MGAAAVLLRSTSGHGGWAQSGDPVEETPEQHLRHGDLGHLEDEVAAVGDDLGADLHHLLPQRGQGPLRDLARQSQGAEEIGEVVGQRVELKSDGIRAERRARQPRPLDRVLPFLDPLLRRPAPVVEGDHLLGGAMEVRHDETDARIQLARMPLDLRHDPALPVPTLRPIAKARVEAPHGVRSAADGSPEQRRDPLLEHPIGRETNGVLEPLRFQVLVPVRQGEGRIAA